MIHLGEPHEKVHFPIVPARRPGVSVGLFNARPQRAAHGQQQGPTETPLAAGRAEATAESLLRANGIGKLRRYPASLQQEALFETGERKPFEASLQWARKEGARYALTGSVDEWRYKVGVDGEPAVGIALSIIDVASGETLWSGAGGKSGWSREALSAVAQQLMRRLIQSGLSARQD